MGRLEIRHYLAYERDMREVAAREGAREVGL